MRAFAAPLLATFLIAAAAPGPLDRIAAGESASVVLDDWCLAHGLPHLRADRISQQEAPDAAVRGALKAKRSPIGYRRVRLACGDRTMSVADNWYLPDRLSPDMNRRLEMTDAPFGLVVQPLAFRRRTLTAGPDGQGRFIIRAELIDRAGSPFSYVIERYAALSP